MKKIKSLISVTACAAAALSVIPFSASAEGNDKIYGTMNIPYADFYAAEIENAYEVDAVSSATASKWSMNEPGKLVAGTFNDGNGTILGVNFPVEINASDAAALTEKYGFTASDSKPAAYKEVTLSGDSLSVSKVVDTNGEQNVDGSADVSTDTRYGDYQLNVKGFPEGDLYGVIVNTKSGEKYALRHLENIWRNGAISWSAGIKTTEVHGNTLSYEDYADSMGKTVTSVTFITLDGVTTVNVGEQYLPVKFEGEVKAADAAAGTGKTSLEFTGFPADYQKKIDAGEGFTATETEISYTNAKPGAYTVKVTDGSGKYAAVSGSYTLTSADIPVKYEDGKLVAADGFSADDAANFIKNISAVEVNGNKFSATGRGGVKVFDEEGTINFEAAGREGNVFDGSGDYAVVVTATGYTAPYVFSIKPVEETPEVTKAPAASSNKTTTTTTTTKKAAGSTTKKAAATDSPKTGVAGVAAPAAILALAGTAAIAFRKKND